VLSGRSSSFFLLVWNYRYDRRRGRRPRTTVAALLYSSCWKAGQFLRTFSLTMLVHRGFISKATEQPFSNRCSPRPSPFPGLLSVSFPHRVFSTRTSPCRVFILEPFSSPFSFLTRTGRATFDFFSGTRRYLLVQPRRYMHNFLSPRKLSPRSQGGQGTQSVGSFFIFHTVGRPLLGPHFLTCADLHDREEVTMKTPSR